MAEHLSRKELKQDKIHDAIEHGAEAVFSHTTLLAAAVLVAVIVAVGYAGWRFYTDRKTVQASAALDHGHESVFRANRRDPRSFRSRRIALSHGAARAEDAAQKFSAVANKYPSTNPGRLASLLRRALL